eukprot:SAG11_NODE_8797_length_975_cov_0.966895_2_plen_111_part_00
MCKKQVRKQVHVQVCEAFERAEAELAAKGCGVVPEAGAEQDEDAYGFLTSAGGFQTFSGLPGISAPDVINPPAIPAPPIDSALADRVRGGGSADDGGVQDDGDTFSNPVG